MKTPKCVIRSLITSSGFAVLALAAPQLEAQDFPLMLSLSLSSTVQGSDDGGNPVDRTKAATGRVATSDILNLIAAEYGTAFPAGSRLSLLEGAVSVVDKSGNLLVPDVASVEVGKVVTSGQSNLITGAISQALSYTFSFSFDDGNGNTFALSGLAKGISSLSASDTTGIEKAQSRFRPQSLATAPWREATLSSQES